MTDGWRSSGGSSTGWGCLDQAGVIPCTSEVVGSFGVFGERTTAALEGARGCVDVHDDTPDRMSAADQWGLPGETNSRPAGPNG